MSLLMDALRKAEQAKRASRGDAAALADTTATPDTTAPPPEAPVTLPELPPRLETLDAEFAPPAAVPTAARASKEPSPPAAKASEAEQRSTARAVFAAKQPPATDRTPIVIGGAALLVALAVVGAYFWWQLKPGPGPKTSAATAPAVPAPVAKPLRPLVPVPAKPLPQAIPATPMPAPAPAAERSPVMRPPAMETAPTSPIRISSKPMTTDPALDEGYAAFQRGDLEMASGAYERALAADPRNADALHGAAAVALRQGRTADAEAHYQRLIEANPADAAAQSALLGLRMPADPVAAESRLKNLLVGQPDAAALHFALGNLYARQSRWSEAQAAYFHALTADGDNPDYLFNLAVSLDQMHQSRLAAQYYRQALAAAAARPAAFDSGRAAARLRDLQP